MEDSKIIVESKKIVEKPKAKKAVGMYVWPDLVFKEYLAAIIVMIILLIWSLTVMAPLREMANPGLTENPAKAPWYFLGLQEILVYFDPWMAGVVLPSLIISGLMMIPYIDNNPKGVGIYSYSIRKFAIFNFIFGFVLWWVLIFIGTFLRGPDWQWYWPWESWAVHKELEDVLIYQPFWGPYVLVLYIVLGFVLPWVISKNFLQKLGIVRYSLLMGHAILMYLVILKIILRLFFNVRYLLVTPWFNI